MLRSSDDIIQKNGHGLDMNIVKVTFQWPNPQCSHVELRGNFDLSWVPNWDPIPMTYIKETNLFQVTIDLVQGRSYTYKFVVDGKWVCDPRAPTKVDSSGITNNVFTVENTGYIERIDQQTGKIYVSTVSDALLFYQSNENLANYHKEFMRLKKDLKKSDLSSLENDVQSDGEMDALVYEFQKAHSEDPCPKLNGNLVNNKHLRTSLGSSVALNDASGKEKTELDLQSVKFRKETPYAATPVSTKSSGAESDTSQQRERLVGLASSQLPTTENCPSSPSKITSQQNEESSTISTSLSETTENKKNNKLHKSLPLTPIITGNIPRPDDGSEDLPHPKKLSTDSKLYYQSPELGTAKDYSSISHRSPKFKIQALDSIDKVEGLKTNNQNYPTHLDNSHKMRHLNESTRFNKRPPALRTVDGFDVKQSRNRIDTPIVLNHPPNRDTNGIKKSDYLSSYQPIPEIPITAPPPSAQYPDDVEWSKVSKPSLDYLSKRRMSISSTPALVNDNDSKKISTMKPSSYSNYGSALKSPSDKLYHQSPTPSKHVTFDQLPYSPRTNTEPAVNLSDPEIHQTITRYVDQLLSSPNNPKPPKGSSHFKSHSDHGDDSTDLLDQDPELFMEALGWKRNGKYIYKERTTLTNTPSTLSTTSPKVHSYNESSAKPTYVLKVANPDQEESVKIQQSKDKFSHPGHRRSYYNQVGATVSITKVQAPSYSKIDKNDKNHTSPVRTKPTSYSRKGKGYHDVGAKVDRNTLVKLPSPPPGHISTKGRLPGGASITTKSIFSISSESSSSSSINSIYQQGATMLRADPTTTIPRRRRKLADCYGCHNHGAYLSTSSSSDGCVGTTRSKKHYKIGARMDPKVKNNKNFTVIAPSKPRVILPKLEIKPKSTSVNEAHQQRSCLTMNDLTNRLLDIVVNNHHKQLRKGSNCSSVSSSCSSSSARSYFESDEITMPFKPRRHGYPKLIAQARANPRNQLGKSSRKSATVNATTGSCESIDSLFIIEPTAPNNSNRNQHSDDDLMEDISLYDGITSIVEPVHNNNNPISNYGLVKYFQTNFQHQLSDDDDDLLSGNVEVEEYLSNWVRGSRDLPKNTVTILQKYPVLPPEINQMIEEKYNKAEVINYNAIPVSLKVPIMEFFGRLCYGPHYTCDLIRTYYTQSGRLLPPTLRSTELFSPRTVAPTNNSTIVVTTKPNTTSSTTACPSLYKLKSYMVSYINHKLAKTNYDANAMELPESIKAEVDELFLSKEYTCADTNAENSLPTDYDGLPIDIKAELMGFVVLYIVHHSQFQNEYGTDINSSTSISTNTNTNSNEYDYTEAGSTILIHSKIKEPKSPKKHRVQFANTLRSSPHVKKEDMRFLDADLPTTDDNGTSQSQEQNEPLADDNSNPAPVDSSLRLFAHQFNINHRTLSVLLFVYTLAGYRASTSPTYILLALPILSLLVMAGTLFNLSLWLTNANLQFSYQSDFSLRIKSGKGVTSAADKDSSLDQDNPGPTTTAHESSPEFLVTSNHLLSCLMLFIVFMGLLILCSMASFYAVLATSSR